ncbi:hypothetical protein D3H55_15460 [Bacillus salacetis]|uniref:Uncharacterized protein n=1 Tax=Bacillus salacetis TaxID=2315464 RepID=A0A3A1QUI0_9BACI|nr:hypothetical protein [Bacillus salacetis]RIW31368.1 hypothetical protein D3H55_15460 [Bacillus salacetis]
MKSPEYGDVPSGERISFQHLQFYLEQGREIEFVYKNREYFISNTKEGRALWMGDDRISEYFSNNSLAFAESVTIQGTAIVDIFKQGRAAVSTVF